MMNVLDNGACAPLRRDRSLRSLLGAKIKKFYMRDAI